MIKRTIFYDTIIPLGDRCICTQIIKHLNFRPIGQKLPFDWIKGGTLESRIELMLSNFENFLNPQYLQKIIYEKPSMRKYNRYYDTKTKLVFAHDFSKELPFQDALFQAMQTYVPKIKRLNTTLKTNKRILLIYMCKNKNSKSFIRKSIKQIRKQNHNSKIDLFILENGIKTMWPDHTIKITKGCWIFRTKDDLNPLFFEDLTEKQLKKIDKIFSKIKLKPQLAPISN